MSEVPQPSIRHPSHDKPRIRFKITSGLQPLGQPGTNNARFATTSSHIDDIENDATKSPCKIVDNCVRSGEKSCDEDDSFSSHDSATSKSDLGETSDDDSGSITTMIVETREGTREHLTVPRTVADIISTLQKRNPIHLSLEA